jgi:hypothetical protein
MRSSAITIIVAPLLAAAALAGCHQQTQGDAVREAYDNKADQIDAVADNQANPVKKQIYKDQANSYREEGKDREKGLEGRQPSSGLRGDKGAKPPQQ